MAKPRASYLPGNQDLYAEYRVKMSVSINCAQQRVRGDACPLMSRKVSHAALGTAAGKRHARTALETP